MTGCSWQSAEFLLDGEVPDTTLRSRSDEWEAAGVFERVADETIAAWDRITGLRLADVCIDGSIHKAPCGAPGTVERTNSWLSNYGQLRRNTDRKPEHRLAQLAVTVAVALIITVKPIDHRNR